MSETSTAVAESPRPQHTKKTRSQVTRKTDQQGDQGTAKPVDKKIKTAVYLSPDLFLNLGVACVYENKSQSEIIEALIKKALKPYGTSIRGDRIRFDDATDRSNSADQVKESGNEPQ